MTDIKKIAGLLQSAINDERYIPSFMMEALSKSQYYIDCSKKIQAKLKAYEGVNIPPIIQETLNVVGALVRCINTRDTTELLKQYVATLRNLDILLKANFTEDEVSTSLRADLDQLDDLSSDEGLEEQLLGDIKGTIEGI